MKPISIFLLACIVEVLFLLGCGPSDKQVNRVIKVGTEIAELQKEYYPAITELGRVAVQIEVVAQRHDPATRAIASEVAQAQQLITDAFTAGQKAQDKAVIGSMYANSEQYILAQEAFKALLKEALERTKAAVSKSHEVRDGLANDKTTKQPKKK